MSLITRGVFLWMTHFECAPRWKTNGALICFLLLTANKAQAASDDVHFNPFETRDQNVLNLVHGQALPTRGKLNEKTEGTWSTSLIITNELNIDSNSNESLLLDYEAYRFNLSYQYGINKNWNIKFDIPVFHQGGGSFDSAIDNWHQFFGLPRANRPFVDDNQYNIQYTKQDQQQISRQESNTTLGDIQIAVAHSLSTTKTTTMSLWGALKLPTGNKKKLSGNGATDISTWLSLDQQLSEKWRLNMNTGAVILGRNAYQNIALSSQVFYGHVMLGWLFSDTFDFKLQLQGHTSYYKDSRLRALDSTYFVTFGTSIKINACNQLDIAMSEDLKVDASPDASLLINWRMHSSNC